LRVLYGKVEYMILVGGVVSQHVYYLIELD